MNLQLKLKSPITFKQRLLLTITLLTLVRVGSFIPLPYLDIKTISSSYNESTTSTATVTTILNTFSGRGTAASISLFSLGILPNINASIIIQLLTTLSPALLKLQKEEGEYGRRKLNDYTRYLTFFCATIESIFTAYSFRELIFNWNTMVLIQISISLLTGSMIILWFSELITKNGIGNGSSILICFNIVTNFPDQIKNLGINLIDNNYLIISLISGLFLITTIGCIYINEAIVKIPLISASQLLRKVSKISLWDKSYLPLRINQAGVMPLVFTSSIMVILSSLVKFIYSRFFDNELFSFFNLVIQKSNFLIEKLFYWGCYGLLVFFFTNFYSKIILDPKDIAEEFRKNSVSIKGVNPGISTRNYLTETIKNLTTLNAFFLVFVIILLNMSEYLLPINNVSIKGFGFTSQLILVNVLIDTFRKVQSLLKAEDVL
ncbi:unnamed protein product [Dictyota dichotoma]